MINDTLFSKGFLFRVLKYTKYRHTDNSGGIKLHYFVYIKCGRARIVTEGKSFYLSEGNAYYLPKGLKYQSHWYGSPRVEAISLGFAYLPKHEDEIYDIQTVACAPEEIELFFKLGRTGEVDAAAIGCLYTLVGMLLPKMAPQKIDKHQEIIEAVKRRLLANPHTTVSELARLSAISQSLLYHIFKTHSDVTINEYRNRVIMERAKELLISTDISIEGISERLAFSSGAYFRKSFKEHFGISPREMRKRANSFS